jgi:hypothetical protein
MSNEFEVHNFYNHDLKELGQIKDEFMGLWNSAVALKRVWKILENYLWTSGIKNTRT